MSKVGRYRGFDWVFAPLREYFPHMAIRTRWYILRESGDHFRTLRELYAHVDRLFSEE